MVNKCPSLLTLMTLCVALSACQQRSAQDADQSCYVQMDEKTLFLGSRECLATLPEEKLSGFWLIGFEYSVFFKDFEDFKNKNMQEAYWLNFDPALDREFSKYQNPDRPALYAISFVGSESRQEGYYGSGFENVHGGVLVKSILEVTKLDDSLIPE